MLLYMAGQLGQSARPFDFDFYFVLPRILYLEKLKDTINVSKIFFRQFSKIEGQLQKEDLHIRFLLSFHRHNDLGCIHFHFPSVLMHVRIWLSFD